MAKLYFRYGTVNSAKTMNLLAVVHNYQAQGKKVLLLKPRIDTRFGNNIVKSRCGLQKEVDKLVEDDFFFMSDKTLEDCSCILVDEAQFLTVPIIKYLREVATEENIPVICYGLRTDFKLNLFEGSATLLALADSIEEIKTTCHFCNKKAIFNIKMINGKFVDKGPSVELGGEEMYLPTCSNCYYIKINQKTTV